jgi:hypothetical protein
MVLLSSVLPAVVPIAIRIDELFVTHWPVVNGTYGVSSIASAAREVKTPTNSYVQ